MAIDDPRKRLMVIRRLASAAQVSKFEQNLKLIAEIASGKAEPAMPREPGDATLAQRLAEGLASRSPRAGQPRPAKNRPEETEKKRRAPASRDRQETAGLDRSE